MANQDHLELLQQGVNVWNAWRDNARTVRPDLSKADLDESSLREVNLRGANLIQTNLSKADLSKANFYEADLSGANLKEADLNRANLLWSNLRSADFSRADLYEARLCQSNLYYAKLSGADLRGADLSDADLRGADLSDAKLSGANLAGGNLGWAQLNGADLTGANLTIARLVETNLENANLTGCKVYGTSAWNLKLKGTKQQDLVITDGLESQVTVDRIQMAQFVYLLLHNENVRDAIDTIGKKGVLLLGRFTEGRVTVLERLREELRKRDFLPIVFNFDKPETKDFTETVRLLAGLSRFVIVDITNPRSAPLELQATVPDYMIPFVPILERGEEPFSMFRDLWIKHRKWVLDPIRYPSVDRLVDVLDAEIIRPAQAKFAELLLRKAEQVRIKDV